METKDKGFYKKGKPFQNMASKIPASEMAHKVDFPEVFKTSFIEKAQKIGKAKNRRERVAGLTSIFIDLNTYISFHKISAPEINRVKASKAEEKGKFDKGQIGIREGKTKLVSDRVPKLALQAGIETGVYRNSENKAEFLKELDLKLAEECHELMWEAKTKEKRTEELADVYEVIDAILKYRNIEMREINPRLQTHEIIQRRKLAKNKT